LGGFKAEHRKDKTLDEQPAFGNVYQDLFGGFQGRKKGKIKRWMDKQHLVMCTRTFLGGFKAEQRKDETLDGQTAFGNVHQDLFWGFEGRTK